MRTLLVLAYILSSYLKFAAGCDQGEFTCGTSQCIPDDRKCDGKDDCGDFSDEINCTKRGSCIADEFECIEGGCILSSKVCDGNWDCIHGADEMDCAMPTTSPPTSTVAKPELLGIFRTADGEKNKRFPVYDKSPGTDIYLRFSAFSCSGHLLEITSQNSDQFFLLALRRNGRIEFLFKSSLGLGVVMVQPPASGTFCDGKRHMLSIQRYLEEFQYRVDRGPTITLRLPALRSPFSRPFRVYTGEELDGCISGIDVIHLRSKTEMHSVGMSRGCKVRTTPSLTVTLPATSTKSEKTESSFERSTNTSPTRTSPGPLVSNSPTQTGMLSTPVTQARMVTNFRSTTGSLTSTAKSNWPVTRSSPATATSRPVTNSSFITKFPFYTKRKTITKIKPTTDYKPVTQSISVTTTGPVATTGHVTSPSESHKSTRLTSSVRQTTATVTLPYLIKNRGSVTQRLSTTVTPFPSGSSTSGDVTHRSTTVTFKPSTIISPSVQRITGVSTPTTLPQSKCEPVQSRMCLGLGYNSTRVPNLLGHTSQRQAEKRLRHFLPFVRANCSSSLKTLLCAVYLPPCQQAQPFAFPPCRRLCEKSRDECSSLMKAFEFDWPEVLNCEEFPDKKEEKCFPGHGATNTPVSTTKTVRTTGVPMRNTAVRVPSSPFSITMATEGPLKENYCGSILTSPTGLIKSPHYPQSYPSNSHCRWAIMLPRVHHVIVITLEHVSLEDDRNCMYDYLVIMDRLYNQVGPRLCGSLAQPRALAIKGNMAVILFNSDKTNSKGGFLIRYRAHM